MYTKGRMMINYIKGRVLKEYTKGRMAKKPNDNVIYKCLFICVFFTQIFPGLNMYLSLLLPEYIHLCGKMHCSVLKWISFLGCSGAVYYSLRRCADWGEVIKFQPETTWLSISDAPEFHVFHMFDLLLHNHMDAVSASLLLHKRPINLLLFSRDGGAVG